DNTSKPTPWVFDEDEPKEYEVLEQSIDGDRATFLIDMKTSTAPRARNQLQLSGKLRLHYELQSGWVTRKWEIVSVENISMKYRAVLPSPSPSPSPEKK
ncbi:MAG: hypothetical protein ACRD68_03170, partial [Pyrinomonadaceae bacterium]